MFFCSSFLFRHVKAISLTEAFQWDVKRLRPIRTVKSATRFPFTPTSWLRIRPFQVRFTILLAMRNVSLPARGVHESLKGSRCSFIMIAFLTLKHCTKEKVAHFTLNWAVRWVTSFHSWTQFLFYSFSLAPLHAVNLKVMGERMSERVKTFFVWLRQNHPWVEKFIGFVVVTFERAGGVWVVWGQFLFSRFSLFWASPIIYLCFHYLLD